MQYVIKFITDTVQAIIQACLTNEILSWAIFLFVISSVFMVISTLWKR